MTGAWWPSWSSKPAARSRGWWVRFPSASANIEFVIVRLHSPLTLHSLAVFAQLRDLIGGFTRTLLGCQDDDEGDARPGVALMLIIRHHQVHAAAHPDESVQLYWLTPRGEQFASAHAISLCPTFCR